MELIWGNSVVDYYTVYVAGGGGGGGGSAVANLSWIHFEAPTAEAALVVVAAVAAEAAVAIAAQEVDDDDGVGELPSPVKESAASFAAIVVGLL